MSSELQQRIESEVGLMSAFAAAYRPRFDAVIRKLNTPEPRDPSQALRLCVEAMGMILDSQARLSQLLTQAATDGNTQSASRVG
jgi:hypothetical protein